MRLIDADALIEGFEAADFDDDPFENCDNAARIVRAAPTIDAIPVEWLEEQRNRVLHIPRRGKDLARLIDGLLAMWNKEGEGV